MSLAWKQVRLNKFNLSEVFMFFDGCTLEYERYINELRDLVNELKEENKELKALLKEKESEVSNENG